MQEFKFGDKVEVVAPGFYKGADGIVVGFDEPDNTYQVVLAYNCIRSFYGVKLKKVRKLKNVK